MTDRDQYFEDRGVALATAYVVTGAGFVFCGAGFVLFLISMLLMAMGTPGIWTGTMFIAGSMLVGGSLLLFLGKCQFDNYEDMDSPPDS